MNFYTSIFCNGSKQHLYHDLIYPSVLEIFNMATFAAELPSIKDEHDRLAQQQVISLLHLLLLHSMLDLNLEFCDDVLG